MVSIPESRNILQPKIDNIDIVLFDNLKYGAGSNPPPSRGRE